MDCPECKKECLELEEHNMVTYYCHTCRLPISTEVEHYDFGYYYDNDSTGTSATEKMWNDFFKFVNDIVDPKYYDGKEE